MVILNKHNQVLAKPTRQTSETLIVKVENRMVIMMPDFPTGKGCSNTEK